jgi:hypothetical protein
MLEKYQLKMVRDNFAVQRSIPYDDLLSKRNLCKVPEDKLKNVTIKDLKPGMIVENTILWVTSVRQSCLLGRVILIVIDND